MESPEYNSALEETEGDPDARALVMLEAELDAYPYKPIREGMTEQLRLF